MSNPLFEIASQKTLIVIDPATLIEYLHKDRQETYEHGFLDGRKSLGMLSKKDAARMLDVSVGTIDNLRTSGKLESAEYCGQVHIAFAEIQRYVREHTNVYYTIKSKMNKQKQS